MSMYKEGFPEGSNPKEFLKKLLLNTGLFKEPEPDLRETFDVKTSEKEGLLPASYGAVDAGYYLHSEEFMLKPIKEEGAREGIRVLKLIRRL